MSTVNALGRTKNTLIPGQNDYRAFHGQHCLLPINTPPQRDAFLADCDLFYAELFTGGYYYLAAGCVFDVDIQGPRQFQIRSATIARDGATLCELLKPEMDLICRAFAGLPICIYASGSKGLHAYIKNPNGFIKAEDPKKLTADIVSAFHQANLPEELLPILDCSFYAHNKGIRPWSCAHPSTGVDPFVLYQTLDWDSEPDDATFLCWLCDFLPRYGPTEATEADSLVVNVATIQTRNTPRVSGIPIPSISRIHKEINASLDEEISTLEEWVSINSGGHTLRSSSGSRKRKYLYFGKDGGLSTWCPIAKAEHPSNCASWVRFENGLCLCTCFDYECRDSLFILRPKIDKPVTYPVDCPEDKITVLAEQPDNPYLPSETIIDMLKEKKRLVVTANMGCGKTQTMSDFIKQLPVDARILVIGTRIQQTHGWMNFFKDHGFRNYAEFRGSLYNEDRLLICLNSLLRVLGIPDSNGICAVKPYDLLVLDEADSLARWLGGTLLQNGSAIFECLKLLIKVSTHTICMDGLPTSALTCMLENLGYMDSFHWVVFNSFRFREVVMCNQTTYFTNCFVDALAGDRNVFFVSNSKTVIMRFKELAKARGIPDDLILAIHGSMSNSERALAANPDDWLKYRLVLANTSLGPGVSFNPAENPLHFSVVMFLAKVSQGAEPVDIAQLVNRVRHLESKKIIGMVLKKSTNINQALVAQEDIYKDRLRNIGEYATSIVEAIGPVRALGKKRKGDLAIQQAEQHFSQLGKRLPPAKRRQIELQYVPTIVPIPSFDEVTQTLVNEPKSCTFGLRFGNLSYEQLCAHILAESLRWCADSEVFLEVLVDIFHKSGAGISTIGPRTMYKDDKDIVQSSHYAYLNKILSLSQQEDESTVLDNDWFFLKIKDLVPQEKYEKTRKSFFENKIPGMDTCLFRVCRILQHYDSTNESIRKALDYDVTRMFEDSVTGAGRPLSNSEFRPQSHPRGASLNNEGTTAEFINVFGLILQSMGKTLDPETKRIVPEEPYTSETFVKAPEEERKEFWRNTKTLARLAIREYPTFGFNSKLAVKTFLESSDTPPQYPADQKTMFPILYQLLAWLGFPIKKKVVRPFETLPNGVKKRMSYHEVTFDSDHIQLCKALVGLDANGKKVTTTEAVEAYFFIQAE